MDREPEAPTSPTEDRACGVLLCRGQLVTSVEWFRMKGSNAQVLADQVLMRRALHIMTMRIQLIEGGRSSPFSIARRVRSALRRIPVLSLILVR